jgi:uncharacterized membrane protein YphA (DoxX/SURF4 family)
VGLVSQAAQVGPVPQIHVGADVAPLGAFVLLTLRLVLGGVFCVAAYFKLLSPQSVSESIQAFKIVHSDALILFGTHTLPWVELFAGVALVLGLWTREAATIIGLLLLLFIGAIIAAIAKGLGGVPCSCFGYWHLICRGAVGWCKVFENGGLIVIAAFLVAAGGGPLSLSRALGLR